MNKLQELALGVVKEKIHLQKLSLNSSERSPSKVEIAKRFNATIEKWVKAIIEN